MKEEGTTPDEREELNKFTSSGRRIDRKEGSSLDGKGSRGELVFLEEVTVSVKKKYEIEF